MLIFIFKSKISSRSVSRVLSWIIICLVLPLPAVSSDLYLKRDEQPLGTKMSAVSFRSCSGWGLQSLLRCRTSGEPLPRLSTLTLKKRAVYFCCTFLRVASTGRYPASCSAEPGLSSPSWARLSNLLNIFSAFIRTTLLPSIFSALNIQPS